MAGEQPYNVQVKPCIEKMENTHLHTHLHTCALVLRISVHVKIVHGSSCDAEIKWSRLFLWELLYSCFDNMVFLQWLSRGPANGGVCGVCWTFETERFVITSWCLSFLPELNRLSRQAPLPPCQTPAHAVAYFSGHIAPVSCQKHLTISGFVESAASWVSAGEGAAVTHDHRRPCYLHSAAGELFAERDNLTVR